MAESKPDGGGDTPGPQAGRRAWLAGWPRGTRLGVLCLALTLVPGMLAGGPPLAAAQALLFFAGWVLLPGLACWALLARAGGEEADELSSAAMGLVFGTLLLGLCVFLCRATGLFGALYAWPAAALLAWLRLRARAPAPAPAAFTGRETGLLLAVLALALVRVPTGISGEVDGWYLMVKDLVFHGGNAAELLKQGPLLDPRVAGRPLNYHLLSHAPVAAMSVVTGESIADLFRFWFLGFYPLVLVMLVYALARSLARSVWAGFLAALALTLHHDLGLGLFGEAGRSAWRVSSHLNLGIFVSPTTCLGLALLAAITRALLRWTDSERRLGPGQVAELALLALAASMAKGSVMPPAIAGAGFAFLVTSARARRIDVRWLGATLVLLLAALPATLYLALGPGSYAGAMFRVAPWATAATSGMGAWLLDDARPQSLAALFARTPTWLDGLLITLPWLPCFLGLGGIGTLAWFASGRPSLRGVGPWILGTGLASMAAAVLLLAPGSSQLFFAYDAQMLMALTSGIGALELWRRRRGLAAALALLAVPFVVAGVGGVVRDLDERLRIARAGPKLWPAWCEGAAWLRASTDPGALLVTLDDGLLMTQFAERRVALAEAPYTPEVHATRWQEVDGQWRIGPSSEDPFLTQKKACELALRRGDAASIARLLLSTGHRGELYLVRDNLAMPRSIQETAITPLPKRSPLDSSPVLEVVFRNEAIAIYRVKE